MSSSRTTDDAVEAGSAANTVDEFLAKYLLGDLEAARGMVREDFSFRAPLLEAAAGKDAYFAGSEQKVRSIAGFRILRQWEQDGEVSTLYELDVHTSQGAASLLMHEWHSVTAGKIASTTMLFDTAAPAVQLLSQALAAHSD